MNFDAALESSDIDQLREIRGRTKATTWRDATVCSYWNGNGDLGINECFSTCRDYFGFRTDMENQSSVNATRWAAMRTYTDHIPQRNENLGLVIWPSRTNA
jgi:hypothetical protein